MKNKTRLILSLAILASVFSSVLPSYAAEYSPTEQDLNKWKNLSNKIAADEKQLRQDVDALIKSEHSSRFIPLKSSHE